MKLVFCVLFVLGPVTWAQSYPLICRGGSNLHLGFESDSRGVAGSYLRGAFQTAPAAGIPAEGQCTWVDRTFRAGESAVFCLRSDPRNLVAGRAQQVIQALASPSGTLRLLVANNNAGCLVVTGFDAVPASVAIRAAPKIPNLRSQILLPQSNMQHVESHEVGGQSLPQPSKTTSKLLVTDSDLLLTVARTVLHSENYAELQTAEKGCQGDLYCLIDYRSRAIAIALGAQ